MSAEPSLFNRDDSKDEVEEPLLRPAPSLYEKMDVPSSSRKTNIGKAVLVLGVLRALMAVSLNNSHKENTSTDELFQVDDPMLESMDPRYVAQIIAAKTATPPRKDLSLLSMFRLGAEDTDQVPKKPKPGDVPQPFAFDAVFGDNMVLQHGSKAAIYGFLGPICTGVQLEVFTGRDKHIFATSQALINATQQPFGDAWGSRPCMKEQCPPYDMLPFNPWNTPLPTWKVLLPPQPPGGNYTIQAQCLVSGTPTADPALSITNVTFGDVWYCSGQSNMWLPLYYTFERNETAKAILGGKYGNLYLMAGHSQHHPYGDHDWHPETYGAKGGTNPWMNARQAVLEGEDLPKSPLFDFGAACWYFAQKLADQGVTIPIGMANTAIGGQRIQEYMDNSTIHLCQNRTSSGGTSNPLLYWEGELFATQVLPFADMTLKGFLWYQGENNMFDVKGNSNANLGYGCEMRRLIMDWRRLWSQTPHTTDPSAPFGIVTLASSGSEGGPDMGAMRMAQTANYGVLPHDVDLPNTFLAQAYDLDDEWGPDMGPCFVSSCCECFKNRYNASLCTNPTLFNLCHGPNGACTACAGTQTFMGGIHPRSKKHVGDRLAIAAYNLIYGGKEAYTGPTLQGCSLQDSQILEIRFNATLLRGDRLMEPVIPPPIVKPDRWKTKVGGSWLYVQTNASQFCMETALFYDGVGTKHPHYICPQWAGGSEKQATSPVDNPYKDGWIQLNFTLAPGTTNAIHVDLSPLGGAAPTAVRYGWDLVNCCDFTDPTLYVTHNCIANCPLQSAKSKLPANPFQARIVDGRCQCVAPQVCSDWDESEYVMDFN